TSPPILSGRRKRLGCAALSGTCRHRTGSHASVRRWRLRTCTALGPVSTRRIECQLGRIPIATAISRTSSTSTLWHERGRVLCRAGRSPAGRGKSTRPRSGPGAGTGEPRSRCGSWLESWGLGRLGDAEKGVFFVWRYAMRTFTDEQKQKLLDLIAKWKSRLRLEHWRVIVEWDKEPNNGDDVTLEVYPMPERHTAHIRVGCWFSDAISDAERENAVVHELLHIHAEPIWETVTRV